MSEWQKIETAPKDGTEFLATDGVLLGVGKVGYYTESETVYDYTDRSIGTAGRIERPNPKAGQVVEYVLADAVHAYDGKAATQDYDGAIMFTPTHWMPLPAKPETE